MQEEGLPPDAKSYNFLFAAIVRSEQPDAGEQCERTLLERMGSNLRPDGITYLYLIQAYAKSGKPEEAERMLNQLCNEYARQPQQRWKPAVQLFSAVMNAWSKQRTQDSPERAEALLKRMKEM